MFNLQDTPLPSVIRYELANHHVLSICWGDYHLLSKVYTGIWCPSTGKILDPSILSGFNPGGAALDDPQLCWGSVDGFRLVVIKKEWLYEEYKKYYDQGDGEWFVTCCVINGMEKNYAVALRAALLRALKLPLNGDRPIEEVQKIWQASWNADAVHREAENILAGRSPQGVEIRYTGQTQPNWWLPPALQSENLLLLHSGSLKEKSGRVEADRQAEEAQRAKEKEEQAKRDAAQDAAVPLTGGLNLFNHPPVGAKAKSPAASPQKPVSSINNTGGW